MTDQLSGFLGNIYARSKAIVFGTVLFSSFWRLWKLIFWQKILENLIFMSSFYPKNGKTGSRKTSITQKRLVIENCSTSRWVTFLTFCQLIIGLRQTISFEWPDFGIKYLITVTPKIQPKFSNFWNSIKCNLTDC